MVHASNQNNPAEFSPTANRSGENLLGCGGMHERDRADIVCSGPAGAGADKWRDKDGLRTLPPKNRSVDCGGQPAPATTHNENNRDAARSLPRPNWEDFFAHGLIRRELARQRIKAAAKTAEEQFMGRIAPSCQPPRTSPILNLFPPRAVWHDYRVRKRGGMSREEIARRTLEAAVAALRCRGSAAQPWQAALDDTTDRIRTRAVGDDPLSIGPPRLVRIPKADGSSRTIACYHFEDAALMTCGYRYLNAALGHLFLPCSRPDIQAIADEILGFRHEHAGPLFVAEVDICCFFDCLDHQVVTQSIEQLLSEARRLDPEFELDARVWRIMAALFASYAFTSDVRNPGEQVENSWPEENLRQIHADPGADRLGLPQGSALSVFAANAVLHRADRAVQAYAQSCGSPLLYRRFLDDMIAIGPDRKCVTEAYEIYRQCIGELRLPEHPPTALMPYEGNGKRLFWVTKTKPPYRWEAASYPRASFVGFQFHADGSVRVRPDTVRKFKARLSRLAKQFLAAATTRGPQTSARKRILRPDLRLSPAWILRLLEAKLTASTAGVILRSGYLGMARHSWSAVFSGPGRRYPAAQIRDLDRHRERALTRFAQQLAKAAGQSSASRWRWRRWTGPKRYLTSLFAQFFRPGRNRRK